ncbi:MAG: DUF167 domain-containing protein [Acidobacteriota bacterium]|nr:DUF167 domain-containing protein [Acidobacteriota bacterium]
MKTRDEPGRARRAAPSRESNLPPFARAVEGGIELSIKVVPGASRSEVAGVLGDRLKVRVSAPAEGGKANRAVVALLEKWLGARDVEVVAGHSTREKTVRVPGVSAIPRL